MIIVLSFQKLQVGKLSLKLSSYEVLYLKTYCTLEHL